MSAKQTYQVSARNSPSGLGNALLAIANEPNSGKNLIVEKVQVDWRETGSSPSSWIGLEALCFITGHSGGEDLPIVKMDSNNPTLPSQITAKICATAAVDTTKILKRTLGGPLFSATLANVLGTGIGTRGSKLAFGEIYNNFFSTTQNIVLREGEGICYYATDIFPAPIYFKGTVIFKSQQTGNPTYSIQFEYNVTQGMPAFSIFNDSGSGKILEVVSVELYECGDYYWPCISIIPIDGIQVKNQGSDVSVVKRDSNNEDLPSSIKVKADCGILLLGNSIGVPSSLFSDVNTGGGITEWEYTFMRGTRGPRFGQVLVLGTAGNLCLFSTFGDSKTFKTNISLKPGSGIALRLGFYDTAALAGSLHWTYKSSFLKYPITMTFTMENYSPPVGGGLLVHPGMVGGCRA